MRPSAFPVGCCACGATAWIPMSMVPGPADGIEQMGHLPPGG
jgi:hypothetical protein